MEFEGKVHSGHVPESGPKDTQRLQSEPLTLNTARTRTRTRNRNRRWRWRRRWSRSPCGSLPVHSLKLNKLRAIRRRITSTKVTNTASCYQLNPPLTPFPLFPLFLHFFHLRCLQFPNGRTPGDFWGPILKIMFANICLKNSQAIFSLLAMLLALGGWLLA